MEKNEINDVTTTPVDKADEAVNLFSAIARLIVRLVNLFKRK